MIEALMLIASWLGIALELTDRRSSRPSEELVVSALTSDVEEDPSVEKEVVTIELVSDVNSEPTSVVLVCEALRLLVTIIPNPTMRIIAIATRAEDPKEIPAFCNAYTPKLGLHIF